MKAQEVLRRYAVGDRNFRNANLRGANFKGQDLSGADFSGADIRGANFTKANLKGVDFSYVKAGWTGSVVFQHKCLIVIYAFIAILFQGFLAAFISLAFSSSILNFGIGLAISFSFISVLIVLGWNGFTDKSLFAIVFVLSLLFVIISQIESLSSVEDLGVAALVAIAFSIGTGMYCVAVLLSAVIFLKKNKSIASLIPFRTALAVCLLTVLTTALISLFRPFSLVAAVTSACFLTATTSFFCLYVVQKALKEEPNYIIIRKWLLRTMISNGGRFCGANLSGSNFSSAQLQGANFYKSKEQETILHHVCWKNSVGIHFANFSDDVLQSRKVRNLLTTAKSGYKADFIGTNLRGVNLSGITLEKANLTQAILSDALLQETILEDAILTETQAINTNFTGAYLTGVTIESWNIDNTTVLRNTDCRYIYLLEHPKRNDDRERRPHNIDKVFEKGDFEKLFKEVQDDVQILIRDGVDPVALRSAFQIIREEYPDLPEDAFRGFQRRGEDVVMTVKVPPEIDKSEFERHWDSGYQAGLKAGREEWAALLAITEQRANSAEAIALALAQNPKPIHHTDNSQTIEIKGNVDGSVIGQGDGTNTDLSVRNQLTNNNQPDRSPDSAQ